MPAKHGSNGASWFLGENPEICAFCLFFGPYGRHLQKERGVSCPRHLVGDKLSLDKDDTGPSQAALASGPAGGKRRGRRKGRRLALFILLLLAVLGAGLFWSWQNRAGLLEAFARDYLAGQGVEDFSFKVEEAGFGGVDIAALRIGPAENPTFSAERVRVRITSLFAGMAGLSGIEVVSPYLRLSYDEENGIGFGALAPLLDGDGEGETQGGMGLLPPFFFKNAVFEAQTPLGDARLGASGDVRWQDGTLSLVLEDCAQLELPPELAWEGVPYAARVRALQLCPGEGGALTFTPGTGAGEASLTLPSFPFEVHREGARRAFAKGQMPALEVKVENGAEGARLAWRAKGGQIALIDYALALSGIEMEGKASLAAGAGERALTSAFTLSSLAVKDSAPVHRFAPLQLSGQGMVEKDTLTWTGMVKSAAGAPQRRLETRLSARHDFSNERGGLTLTLPLTTFAPRQLELARLVPLLRGHITRAAGELSGEARLFWQGGTLTSKGEAALRGFGFSTAAARIEGIDGTVALASLMPPVTAGPQRLEVGRLSAGIELLDGQVQFELEPSGAVQVQEASWPFAGGTISLDEGTIEPAAPSQEFTLRVRQVALDKLLDLLALDGASGTGRVSGYVPVVIEEGKVLVKEGKLKAEGEGVLAYNGPAGEAQTGGQSDLVFQALKNFHYKGLEMTLNGNALDRLTLGLFIEGANPDLYDGYPFKINIRTEAAFAELLQRGTVGFRALDVIREQGTPAP